MPDAPEFASHRAEPPAEVEAVFQELFPGSTIAAGMNRALPELYDELRDLAAGYLRHERPNHTLQPTALVHESYLRLVNQRKVDWNDRLQFLSIAARMMRRILTDYAAAHRAEKRGSGQPTLELDAALDLHAEKGLGVAEVDEALRNLETLDPRQAQIVEMRFFGGMTIEEISSVLDTSPRTVNREWAFAKRWLRHELSGVAA